MSQINPDENPRAEYNAPQATSSAHVEEEADLRLGAVPDRACVVLRELRPPTIASSPRPETRIIAP